MKDNILTPFADSDKEPIGYTFWCPGCEEYHGVWVQTKNPTTNGQWTWNGNMIKPTFSPSILVRGVSLPKVLEKDNKGKHVLGPDGRIKGAKDTVCHTFVREGMIQFLNDCTHKLAGQTVALLPDPC